MYIPLFSIYTEKRNISLLVYFIIMLHVSVVQGGHHQVRIPQLRRKTSVKAEASPVTVKWKSISVKYKLTKVYKDGKIVELQNIQWSVISYTAIICIKCIL